MKKIMSFLMKRTRAATDHLDNILRPTSRRGGTVPVDNITRTPPTYLTDPRINRYHQVFSKPGVLRRASFGPPVSRGRMGQATTRYDTMRQRTDHLARKLGFDDEAAFARFIQREAGAPGEASSGLARRLFDYLKTTATKHPGSIAKGAIVGGSVAAMITYLYDYQRTHTGCFRYQSGSIHGEKMAGNYCQGEGGSEVELIPGHQHPLYGLRKWDCDYAHSGDSSDARDILALGCCGLCNWQNFNTLAAKASGYHPYAVSPAEADGDPADPVASREVIPLLKVAGYDFRCEQVTFLRALSTTLGEAVDETVTGLMGVGWRRQLFMLVLRGLFVLGLLCALYGWALSARTTRARATPEKNLQDVPNTV